MLVITSTQCLLFIVVALGPSGTSITKTPFVYGRKDPTMSERVSYREIYDGLEPITDEALLNVEAVAMGHNFFVGFGFEDIRRLILRLRIAEEKLDEIPCDCDTRICVADCVCPCPRDTYVYD
jgi:hypothetical protein